MVEARALAVLSLLGGLLAIACLYRVFELHAPEPPPASARATPALD